MILDCGSNITRELSIETEKYTPTVKGNVINIGIKYYGLLKTRYKNNRIVIPLFEMTNLTRGEIYLEIYDDCTKLQITNLMIAINGAPEIPLFSSWKYINLGVINTLELVFKSREKILTQNDFTDQAEIFIQVKPVYAHPKYYIIEKSEYTSTLQN